MGIPRSQPVPPREGHVRCTYCSWSILWLGRVHGGSVLPILLQLVAIPGSTSCAGNWTGDLLEWHQGSVRGSEQTTVWRAVKVLSWVRWEIYGKPELVITIQPDKSHERLVGMGAWRCTILKYGSGFGNLTLFSQLPPTATFSDR